jgi:KDO2-lipid IV(A) lauroyltransferase
VSASKQSIADTTSLLHPRFWPNWLGIGVLRVISWLPFDWQLTIGSLLGSLAYLVAGDRRHIAETNIKLCFPELSPTARTQLVKKTFRNNGRGIMETAFAWTGRIERISSRISFSGLDVLQRAASEGKGVLLLGMHFSTLDLCGAALGRQVPFDVMYRRNKNQLLESTMRAGRIRNFPNAIERSDIRSVIKALKAGHVVWYGPDQDYGRKHSVFAPFFGIETASITATARIAKITGAPVVVFQHRRSDNNQYIVELSEPLEDYPTGNEITDAARINQLVESAIRKAPDQYWWVHRRFKTRPSGETRPY